MNSLGRVLVVDDELSLRNTLTRILRQGGCEVASAEDGDMALRMLAAEPYDLVYLDIRLPGRDGLQTLRELRQQDAHLAVILLTAYGSLHTALEALRLGATDYLLKPVDPDVLLARTLVLLKEQAIERRRREIQEQIARYQEELRALDLAYPQAPAAAQPVSFPPGAPKDRFLKRGSLILDLQAQRATLGREVIALPPATFDYLVVLARHSPEPVNYQTLVTEAQGYQVDPSEARELAKYHIHVMRQALEKDPKTPQHIHNVRSVGYRFLVDELMPFPNNSLPSQTE
jgi:DNA-binding response OmpR family regulator